MDRVIFEIITPPETWPQERIADWGGRICGILKRHRLSFLNIPEVVNEEREGDRGVPFIPKVDNLAFAKIMSKRSRKAIPILNKISVRIPRGEFEAWIAKVHKEGVRHVLVVGGELPDYPYPGYPVTEAAAYIKNHFPDMTVGGITIFTRPHEAERILAKIKAGIDFLVSQIIFETANMKQVFSHLARLTETEGLSFPPVYVSLAPASRIRDVEFMRWLGVEFPSAILSYFIHLEEEGLAGRAFEVIERVMDEIFDFAEKEKLEVGFNVEHVMYNNLDLTERLLEEIRERMTG